MKSKLFVLLIMAAFIVPPAYSQLSFGVRAGFNLQNLNGEEEGGAKLKNDLKPGFFAGVDVEIPVAPDFYVQPGLLFSTKGAANLNETEIKANLAYIELPIHLLYKPMLGSGNLILGLGPYLAYGIDGKLTLDGDEEDIKFTNDVTEDDEGLFFLRPLDAGADIFFGYEMPFGLSAQFHAQLGLLNLMPKIEGEDGNAITKNTGFGLSLCYRFKL